MKKNIKSSLSMFLIATLLVAPNSTMIYASTDTNKIVEVEVDEDETYFIKEDGSLWRNGENTDFVKVWDDVVEVYPESEWGDCAFLTKDGTLMLYEHSSKNNIGYTTEVATNVKSAQFTPFELYIVTNNNELVLYTVKYKNQSDLQYKFESEFLLDNVEDVISNGFGIWTIDSSKTLWYYEYSTEKEPEKVLSNVSSVAFGNESAFVLDINGNLYNINNYITQSYNNKNLNVTKDNIIATDVKEIATNFNDSYNKSTVFIIKEDNTLWGLGGNYTGQLGTGRGNDVIKDFVKIADNVKDVDVSSTHTVYVTNDGKLWGMGSNKSGELGDSKEEAILEFDENGYVEIATDVESADLFYNITTFRLVDGTLWGLGDNTNNVISSDTIENYIDPMLIAENVKWWNVENLGNTLPYVVGEEKELYFNGINYSFEIGQIYINSDVYKEIYEFYFETLEIDTTFEYYKDNKIEVENIIYEKLSKLSDVEIAKFKKSLSDFLMGLLNESNSIPVSTGVVQSSEEYFVDTKNDLYIINENNEKVKIRSNVKSVFTENMDVYIVDTDDNLKYAKAYEDVELTLDYEFEFKDNRNDLEPGDQVSAVEYTETGSKVTVLRKVKDLNFVDVGIKGVKAIEGYNDNVFVLKNDGTLIEIEYLYDYVYKDKDGKYTGEIYLGTEKSDFREVKDKLKSIEVEDGIMYFGYEDENNEYWSGNATVLNKDELLILDGYGYKVSVVATGAETFAVDYDKIVYVDKNDILWGKGDNSKHQLTNENVVYYDEYIQIIDNVKMADVDENSLVVLLNDGTLIGRGLNEVGELGFEGQGAYYDPSNVYKPIEININKSK